MARELLYICNRAFCLLTADGSDSRGTGLLPLSVVEKKDKTPVSNEPEKQHLLGLSEIGKRFRHNENESPGNNQI